jgi:transposase
MLRCADGLPSKSVAAELGLHEHTVGKWRRRFLKDRCDGLLDEARAGRPRTINDDQVAAVIERTLRTAPADATHWSIRSMAAETGFSHTTIRRMWAAFGLQPMASKPATAHRVIRRNGLILQEIRPALYSTYVEANTSRPAGGALCAKGETAENIIARAVIDLVIPECCVSTRPQMRNCTSRNLEIPGSMLRIAPE